MMIKQIKLERKDKKFLKKVGKNTTNLLKIIEKYEGYLDNSNRTNKEKDAMSLGISTIPVQLILNRMDDDMKKEMIMFMVLQNMDMLMRDINSPVKDRLKERRIEKDYIG